MIKLPKSYLGKYKWRMFSYRTRSFLINIFGREGRRGSRIFSIFAVFILVLLIASISLYGLNLRSRAENQTQISAVTVVNYDGVSIHTKAARMTSLTPRVSDHTATAKTGDTVSFTLTVSNAGTGSTATDVKFTLPAQFSYQGMISGAIPGGTPTKDSCGGAPAVAGDAGIVLYWCNYNAPVGESIIELDTKAP